MELKGKILFEETTPASSADPHLKAAEQFAGAEFTPDPEAIVSNESAAIPPQKRQSRWHWRLLKLGIAALVGLSIFEWVSFWLRQLNASPILGGAWLLATGLIVFGAVLALIGEWRTLRKLKRRQQERERAQLLLVDGSQGEGRRYCQTLAQECDLIENVDYQRWLSLLDNTQSDREVITLYSHVVLQESDRRARAQVVKWSSDAAAWIALTPMASLDMLLILWRNLRMIDAISNSYGIEMSYWGRISLLRKIFRNMLLVGATELVAEVGLEILGASTAGKLSARISQGMGAGILTARLGLMTIEQCRPLPWCGNERLTLSDLRKSVADNLLKLG